MAKSTLFVMVVYKQSIEKSKTYQSLLKYENEKDILIYDNSPKSQNKCTNSIYYHNPQNPGLGYAYNRAAEYARENGYDWLLLLDQDTIFPKDALKAYLKAIEQYPDIHLFAPMVKVANGRFMSPAKIKNHTGKLHHKYLKGICSFSEYSPINSGMMIHVESFWAANGYNEEVFLDYSDHEFIRRFKKIDPYFCVVDLVLEQNFSVLSDSPEKKLFRFQLFCDSIKHCEKRNITDHLNFAFIVGKRTMSLCIELKSIRPIKIFIQRYII